MPASESSVPPSPTARTAAAPVFVNGKFLAQRTTGVQRVARALLAAVDADQALPAERLVLLCPAQAESPGWQRIGLRRIGPAGLPLHLWEQAVLPVHARHGLLLNLTGSAPWFARRCATMLHDAAVWDAAESYSGLFRLWYRALFRRQGRRAEHLFTVSAHSLQRLSERLHLAPGRCLVLRNGADHLDPVAESPGALQRLGLQDRRFLLTVGSRSPAKNLGLLARAYGASGIGPGVALVCVGGGNPRVFAADPARGAGPREGWIDAGVLPDAELKALYRHALALLVPSRHEGFCLPAAEALWLGCPVLASNATALPSLFGESVARMPVDDEAAWAAALRRLTIDDAWRATLLQSGRQHLGDARWADTARQLVGALGLRSR